jgi:hypothetical protein
MSHNDKVARSKFSPALLIAMAISKVITFAIFIALLIDTIVTLLPKIIMLVMVISIAETCNLSHSCGMHLIIAKAVRCLWTV